MHHEDGFVEPLLYIVRVLLLLLYPHIHTQCVDISIFFITLWEVDSGGLKTQEKNKTLTCNIVYFVKCF